MTWGTRIANFTALGFFSLWVIGAILSDRWSWSQWLSWIPTPLVIFVFTLVALFFFFTRKRNQSIIYFGFAAITAIWFCSFEHKLFSSKNGGGSVSILGWTMSHPKDRVAKESANIIVQMNSDITLLTHGWRVRGEPAIQEWLGTSGHRVVNSQFTLFTRFAPLKIQTLIATDGIYISSFVLDTTSVIGDVLVLWAVDFPSSLTISKMDTAHRIRRLLQSIDTLQPDIVIGDFNMTRNSVARRTIFPTLQNAASSAGTGILTSFPVEYPLFHIDHILFSSRLTVLNYTLLTPHIGRHRIQVADFDISPEK